MIKHFYASRIIFDFLSAKSLDLNPQFQKQQTLDTLHTLAVNEMDGANVMLLIGLWTFSCKELGVMATIIMLFGARCDHVWTKGWSWGGYALIPTTILH